MDKGLYIPPGKGNIYDSTTSSDKDYGKGKAKYTIEKSGLEGQNECLEKCSRFPKLEYVYYNDKGGSSNCECKTKSSNIAGNPQEPDQNWKMIQKTRKN